jgi:hypothetical protein
VRDAFDATTGQMRPVNELPDEFAIVEAEDVDAKGQIAKLMVLERWRCIADGDIRHAFDR